MNNIWITSDAIVVEEYTEAEVKRAEEIVSMINTVLQNVPSKLGKLILAANEDENNDKYQLRTIWDKDGSSKWLEPYDALAIDICLLDS